MQIVESGLELIHHHGFSATGVAAIADAAKAPKGSFYNHFKSKDDFGSAVLDRYFEDVRSALSETLHAPEQDAALQLRTYFIRLRDYNARTNYARGCLIGNISAEVASANDAMRAQLASLLAQWSGHLAACIAEGQRNRGVRADISAATLAGLLLDAWQGAVLRSKVERSPAALNKFVDVLLPQLIGRRQ